MKSVRLAGSKVDKATTFNINYNFLKTLTFTIAQMAEPTAYLHFTPLPPPLLERHMLLFKDHNYSSSNLFVDEILIASTPLISPYFSPMHTTSINDHEITPAVKVMEIIRALPDALSSDNCLLIKKCETVPKLA